METRRFKLEAVAPFDFELTLEVTPPAYPFVYESGSLRRGFKLGSGRLAPVEVRSVGTVRNPLLEVIVYASLTKGERDQIERELSWFLCLEDDLGRALELMRGYERLAPLVGAFEGVRPWMEMRPFEGLVSTVLFQQISVWAAFSIIRSLVQRLGPRVEARGKVFYEFPDARELASAPISRLRACKLSRNKSDYVRALARRFVEGDLDFESLAAMPPNAALERLRELRHRNLDSGNVSGHGAETVGSDPGR
jgi:3-methyladenine DNA glycosylase/8-oxoguanine DNA glycosylase